MTEVNRQGMVKTVTVREYEGEAKFLRVTIKAPTTLPVAAWQSGSKETPHVDEFDIALPLTAKVRPGDIVAFRVQISTPFIESQRFQLALDVGESSDDVLEVMVEDAMREGS